MFTCISLVFGVLLSTEVIRTHGGNHDQLLSAEVDAASRADQSLQGLFNYFWRKDPKAKQVQFFYACGQIGSDGFPSRWDRCSCDKNLKLNTCVNCYRWWDAIAMESIASHGIYTDTKAHANIADVIFAHSPYNANWNATSWCTYVDDFVWYGIAYLRVYEWLKVGNNHITSVGNLSLCFGILYCREQNANKLV